MLRNSNCWYSNPHWIQDSNIVLFYFDCRARAVTEAIITRNVMVKLESELASIEMWNTFKGTFVALFLVWFKGMFVALSFVRFKGMLVRPLKCGTL